MRRNIILTVLVIAITIIPENTLFGNDRAGNGHPWGQTASGVSLMLGGITIGSLMPAGLLPRNSTFLSVTSTAMIAGGAALTADIIIRGNKNLAADKSLTYGQYLDEVTNGQYRRRAKTYGIMAASGVATFATGMATYLIEYRKGVAFDKGLRPYEALGYTGLALTMIGVTGIVVTDYSYTRKGEAGRKSTVTLGGTPNGLGMTLRF